GTAAHATSAPSVRRGSGRREFPTRPSTPWRPCRRLRHRRLDDEQARSGPARAFETGSTMYRVSREIAFCYGHRLLNYDGKCRHLHGHNGRAVITLQGAGLDRCGMLVDFGEIKEKVQ